MSEYKVNELLASMLALKLEKKSSKQLKPHLFKGHRSMYRKMKQRGII
jgi:hypothetical protein